MDTQQGLTFMGDHLLSKGTPVPLLRPTPPDQPRHKSLLEYQESLNTTRARELGVCYPGHGDPIADHRPLVDELLARHERRTAKVLDILSQVEATPFELCTKMFGKLKTSRLHVSMSIAIGHLEVLEERGQARSVQRDGVLWYTAETTSSAP